MADRNEADLVAPASAGEPSAAGGAPRFRGERLTATFEFVTPAFLGGYNHAPELRLPSILGVLRFWWRALAWSRACVAIEQDDTRARLRLIHKWEADLFGAAAGGERGGQGAFQPTLRPLGEQASSIGKEGWHIGGYYWPPQHRAWDVYEQKRDKPQGVATSLWAFDGSGLAYLAGQGVASIKSEKIRDDRGSGRVIADAKPGSVSLGRDIKAALLNSSRFCIDFIQRPAVGAKKPRPLLAASENDRPDAPPSLEDALQVMGLLGGIGARSRRGFGSLSLIGLSTANGAQSDQRTPEQSCADYLQSLQTRVKPLLLRRAAALFRFLCND